MLIVIKNFLNENEVAHISKGVVSQQWRNGQLTAGGIAKDLKNNQQLDDESESVLSYSNYLLKKLGNHPQFVSAAIPQKIHPPRFNRYAKGETYSLHVDAPIMSMPLSNEVMRSDVSATLFLSDPESYVGGELSIEGEFGRQEIKLNAGDMVVYPSSSLHQVRPVQSGERVAAILWVQSMVADASKRRLLFDLDKSIQNLTRAQSASSDELMRLSSVYHNLIRRWANL